MLLTVLWTTLEQTQLIYDQFYWSFNSLSEPRELLPSGLLANYSLYMFYPLFQSSYFFFVSEIKKNVYNPRCFWSAKRNVFKSWGGSAAMEGSSLTLVSFPFPHPVVLWSHGHVPETEFSGLVLPQCSITAQIHKCYELTISQVKMWGPRWYWQGPPYKNDSGAVLTHVSTWYLLPKSNLCILRVSAHWFMHLLSVQ